MKRNQLYLSKYLQPSLGLQTLSALIKQCYFIHLQLSTLIAQNKN